MFKKDRGFVLFRDCPLRYSSTGTVNCCKCQHVRW